MSAFPESNDAVAAVVAFLNETLPELDGRVFARRLPRSEASHMPRSCVVVRPAGGAAMAAGFRPTVDARIDVRCYGATDHEVALVTAAVTRVLHHARDERTPYGRILWCRLAGGASGLVEPQAEDWPLELTSWQVYGDWLSDGGTP